MIGQRFGRLVVIEQAGKRGAARLWRCRCDCGAEVAHVTGRLNAGRVQSCGCLANEVRAANARRAALKRWGAYDPVDDGAFVNAIDNKPKRWRGVASACAILEGALRRPWARPLL